MFKRRLIASAVLVFTLFSSQAQQKYYTKTGKIDFYSKAPLEDIVAKNKTVTAVIDIKTGAIQFSVQMKGFEFQKALMRDHFNENYVESNKYPKSEFRGTILNNAEVNYAKEGSYTVKVKGKLTIHGVTKEIEVPGTIRVSQDKIEATSSFSILLTDYKIAIPSIMKDKISNTIKINIDTKLEPLKE